MRPLDRARGRFRIRSIKARATAGAARRLSAWRALIHGSSGLTERGKLQRVNRFFNRLRFAADDEIAEPGRDHWATPREFLVCDAGDCEDFALAKYFTLRALGVARQRLRLMYVLAVRRGRAHMVLAYYLPTDSVNDGVGPVLALDNLIAGILPLSQRADLAPVYAFNGDGLWLVTRKGRGRRVAGAGRLSRWRDLLRRMGRERGKIPF